jgi:hypothetical protein
MSKLRIAHNLGYSERAALWAAHSSEILNGGIREPAYKAEVIKSLLKRNLITLNTNRPGENLYVATPRGIKTSKKLWLLWMGPGAVVAP